jgi:HSP20 family protein
MSKVSIQKYHQREDAPVEVFQAVERVFDEVRRHAFDLFSRRGGADGWDLADWLQAERQLLPQSELIDKGAELHLRVALPGYDPNDVEVTALPDSILVQAKATRQTVETEEAAAVQFSEFGRQSMSRRFDLPDPIDIEKVTARLDKGILEIAAAKAAAKGKAITVSA